MHPLEAALALDPDSASLHEFLGLTWYQLGRYDRALEHFWFLQAADRDDPAWHAYVGQCLYAEGDKVLAAAHLQHALSLARADPVLADSHRYMGWLRYDQGRYADAEIWFQRALIMDPQDPQAMAGLGWCYVQKERCQDAGPLFREALSIDPYLQSAMDGQTACLSEGEEPEE